MVRYNLLYMSSGSFRIMNVKEIPIYVHITFFLTFFLFTFIFIRSPYPYGFADVVSVYIKYGLSLIAAVLFFALLLVHELAHSLMAKFYGITIKNITMFFFGGVSVFEEMPKNPKRELMIAFAGPISSIVFGLFFLGIYALLFSASIPDKLFMFEDMILHKKDVSTLFLTVGALTVFLGIFNMLPLFPLDGGRVLRAFFATFMTYHAATQTAAKIGQAFAVVMAVFGLFFNLWLSILALFLYISAGAESKHVTESSLLEGIRAKDIMTKNIITVDSDMSLANFINFVIEHKHPSFPVLQNQSVVGMISINHVRSVNEVEQYALTVYDVMEKDYISVHPETSAVDALNLMNMSPLGRLLVFDERKNLIGLIAKSDIMLYLSVKDAKKQAMK